MVVDSGGDLYVLNEDGAPPAVIKFAPGSTTVSATITGISGTTFFAACTPAARSEKRGGGEAISPFPA